MKLPSSLGGAPETRLIMEMEARKETGLAAAHECLRELDALVEELLISGPGRVQREIAPAYREMAGSFAEARILMTSARYSGAGMESLTISKITDDSGGLRSLTVIGQPEPGSKLPILGMDLIALRGPLSLIAVDLSPTDDELFDSVWRHPLLSLLAANERLGPQKLTLRKRPDFCAETFSPHAAILAARPGQEPLVKELLTAFVRESARLFAEATSGPEPSWPAARAHASRQRVLRWREAELRNRKEVSALASLFGPERARSFLSEFLFGSLG